jgi:hypothetical protein
MTRDPDQGPRTEGPRDEGPKYQELPARLGVKWVIERQLLSGCYGVVRWQKDSP